MTQRTCCVSSRPAPHLADRFLSKLSSRTKLTKRVARLSRRALAALLLVGGAGLAMPSHTASGHDHLPDAADAAQPIEMPAAVSLPARLENDAMLLQWLQSADAARAACADANQAVEMTVSETSILTPAKRPSVVVPTNDQAAIDDSEQWENSCSTAANQWGDYCDFQHLLAWGNQAKTWVSPLADAAASVTPIVTEAASAASRSITRGLSDLSCEEPIDIATNVDAEQVDAVADVDSSLAAELPESAGDESEIDWIADEFPAPKVVDLPVAEVAAEVAEVVAVPAAELAAEEVAVPAAEVAADVVAVVDDALVIADEDGPVTQTTAPAADPPAESEEGASVASDAPEFNAMALVGGGAIVASIPESYMPYDLSPEDAIAMRMYPLDSSPIDYLGARRTGMYSPLNRGSVSDTWQQVIEESVVVSTPGAADPQSIVVASDDAVEPTEAPAQPDDADHPQLESIAALAQSAIAAVQPDSQWRQQLGPRTLGAELGEFAGLGLQAADAAVGDLTARLAAVWQPAPRPAAPNQPAERLVAEAELLPPQAVEGADRILQIELACQAAIDVVRAQGSRLQGDSGVANEEVAVAAPPAGETATRQEIARAEAVATACDLAAASLERLAMSLRRAGDSVVRQAKANASAEQPLLR